MLLVKVPLLLRLYSYLHREIAYVYSLSIPVKAHQQASVSMERTEGETYCSEQQRHREETLDLTRCYVKKNGAKRRETSNSAANADARGAAARPVISDDTRRA